MPTLSVDVHSWTSATIDQLVADQQPETLLIEFKREAPLVKQSDKREVAKDVSALANTSGGWIVYGIEERVLPTGTRVAGGVTPLATDVSGQMDDILAGQVSPPLRYRRTAVPHGQGVCIAFHVEQSTRCLHQVDGRFYRRTEKGARPMAEPEVRQAYAQIVERERHARDEAVKIASEEAIGQPAITVVLIPQTFGEVIDPGAVGDEVAQLLSPEMRKRMQPTAKGLESSLSSDQYRFRLRRDGVVSLRTPGHNPDCWFPSQLLRDICLAHKIAAVVWPKYGIYGDACISVSLRFGGKRKTQVPISILSNDPEGLILAPPVEFCLPVSGPEVANPLGVARRVLDRVWQAMGCKYSGFFDSSGALHPDCVGFLRE